jgi:hypothetical protein
VRIILREKKNSSLFVKNLQKTDKNNGYNDSHPYVIASTSVQLPSIA